MKKTWYHDSFWHQQLIDLWTVPHLLFGVLPAVIFAFLGLDMLFGLGLTVIAAILWEIGEVVGGVSSDEVASNKISDVFIAAIGYTIMWCIIYMSQPSSSSLRMWITFVFVALVVTSAIGWYGYHLWHAGK